MDSSTKGISPLRQRMLDDMRMRKLSDKTQSAYIRAVLQAHDWRVPDAARTLGIERANLYRKARKLAREYGACILFIDEIDAIGGARSSALMGGGGMGGMGAEKQAGGIANVMMGMGMGGGSGLLNELLLQMDPPPQETSQAAARPLRPQNYHRRAG